MTDLYNHNCYDLDNIDGYDNDQPIWLQAMGGIDDTEELAAIIQGGCASGAFMPAVSYYTATRIMSDHGDDILNYIDSVYGEIPSPQSGESWSGMAVYYCSMAVELWCSEQEQLIIECLEAMQNED
jgi:hypothetical protein